MSEKKTLIIFDLIGTLVDAGPRYVQAFAAMCGKYGYPAPDPEEIAAMLGEKSLKEITEHYMGSLDDKDKQSFMRECNESCDALLFDDQWHEHLYDGMKDMIKELHGKGHALGIYTGTREEALQDQLSYHQLEQYFEPAYLRAKDNQRDSGLDTQTLKTQQLTEIVAAFKSKNGNDVDILVVGDSESDAQAAQALRLSFIGFADTKKKEERLSNCGVKVFCKDFSELPALVLARKLMHKSPSGRNNKGKGPSI